MKKPQEAISYYSLLKAGLTSDLLQPSNSLKAHFETLLGLQSLQVCIQPISLWSSFFALHQSDFPLLQTRSISSHPPTVLGCTLPHPSHNPLYMVTTTTGSSSGLPHIPSIRSCIRCYRAKLCLKSPLSVLLLFVQASLLVMEAAAGAGQGVMPDTSPAGHVLAHASWYKGSLGSCKGTWVPHGQVSLSVCTLLSLATF